MKGFILAMGRSGTTWCATALARCTDLDARHESMRKELGRSFDGVESNGNFWRDAWEIRMRWPEVAVAHLVRDGRKVCRSKLSHFPDRPPERVFDMWVRYNARLIQDVPAEDRYRLEDLTTDFATFRRFAGFLGATRVDEQRWQGIRQELVNRTRRKMYPAFDDWPEDQQRLFWQMCGETMRECGYERELAL